jgi:hypothetical protein
VNLTTLLPAGRCRHVGRAEEAHPRQERGRHREGRERPNISRSGSVTARELAETLGVELPAAGPGRGGRPRVRSTAARTGCRISDEWLNNGPIQLGEVLPPGWRDRVQPAFRGEALVLDTLGRADLLKTKLFALCDRGLDLADCIALAPTAGELTEAKPWVAYQDANPDWPAHVEATLKDLSRRLRHGA